MVVALELRNVRVMTERAEKLRDRFDTDPWMLTYKAQQRDGPFWDRASAKGRYQDIRVMGLLEGELRWD